MCGIEIPVILDTGSSDLWVISDACSNCSSTLPLYPEASLQPTGLDVALYYGDSNTGTHAFGPIGKDTVSLSDLTLQNQYFAAINNTNTSVLQAGSAGIFGLGFAINSVIWTKTFEDNLATASRKRTIPQPVAKSLRDFAVRFFPKNFSFNRRHPGLSSKKSHQTRQSEAVLPDVLSSFSSLGPFLNRLVVEKALAAPLVTITLERDSVDIGGNLGLFSIGELPNNVQNDSLTWTLVRGYPTTQGGLAAPADSPGEVYPVTWEIPLDDVYLDGEKLARSTLATNISLSALLDTGNSLIRGPSDVVQAIMMKLGGDDKGNFPCSNAHTLSFEFSGKMFPVDPRDFIQQTDANDDTTCTATLAVTDSPKVGSGYLYSWSLGDPFLKSVLTSFYYGNISYPSQDPARIGLLSTVPSDASAELASALASASANGGNLPAPSTAPTGTTSDSNGVAQAANSTTSTVSSTASSSSAIPRLVPSNILLLMLLASSLQYR
ncbi:hypothetical protein HWV62_24920 [Athelia sp. TMB]|nr:hypothetical protein HWV62_24920 [Athelia sp. TMB]